MFDFGALSDAEDAAAGGWAPRRGSSPAPAEAASDLVKGPCSQGQATEEPVVRGDGADPGGAGCQGWAAGLPEDEHEFEAEDAVKCGFREAWTSQRRFERGGKAGRRDQGNRREQDVLGSQGGHEDDGHPSSHDGQDRRESEEHPHNQEDGDDHRNQEDNVGKAAAIRRAAKTWADLRRRRLREELNELRRWAVYERRVRLRALQLELHPDKQPPELRDHAQALFLLVQAEWEAHRLGSNDNEEADAEVRRQEQSRQQEQKNQVHRHRTEGIRRWAEMRGPSAGRHGMLRSGKSAGEDSTWKKRMWGEDPDLVAKVNPGGIDGVWNAWEKDDEWPSSDLALRIRAPGAAEHYIPAQVSWTLFDVKAALEERTHIPRGLQRLKLVLHAGAADSGDLHDSWPLGSLLPRTGNVIELELVRRHSRCVDRVLQNWRALQHAPSELQADKDLVLSAVKQNWQAFRFAAPCLRAHKEVALAAVRQEGMALELASPALRCDREVVMSAVRQNWRALGLTSPELRADRSLIADALQQDWLALEHVPDAVRADRELMSLAVRYRGSLLRFASQALRADAELVLAAAQQDGAALEHAALELRSDKLFMLNAARGNGAALRFAAPELRGDEDLALAAVAWDSSFCER